MTKSYIITSAYTGNSRKVLGTHSKIDQYSVLVYNNEKIVAIIPNRDFMIEIEDSVQ